MGNEAAATGVARMTSLASDVPRHTHRLCEQFITSLASFLFNKPVHAFLRAEPAPIQARYAWLRFRGSAGQVLELGMPLQAGLSWDFFHFSCLARSMAYLSRSEWKFTIAAGSNPGGCDSSYRVDLFQAHSAVKIGEWLVCCNEAEGEQGLEKVSAIAPPCATRCELGCYIAPGALPNIARGCELPIEHFFLRSGRQLLLLERTQEEGFLVKGEIAMNDQSQKITLSLGSFDLPFSEFSALRPGMELFLDCDNSLDGALCIGGVPWASVRVDIANQRLGVKVLDFVCLEQAGNELPDLATLAEILRLDSKADSQVGGA